jgi:imidazole glycerol-phosphate synthase subunit HisH
MIAIVDYGIGNLGSVMKGLRHAGAETVLTGDARALEIADALVLPGDGAFGATMDEIRARGLLQPLLDAVASGKPLLGICIGMQLLFEESEEHGRHQGLGLLPGRVRRIPGPLPVPHMGWNRIRKHRDHSLLDGVEDGAHVYFVHSYYCAASPAVTIASTDYGLDLAAIVGSGNVLGVQFHPEKSQRVGLTMLRSWVASLGLGQRGAETPAMSVGGEG